MPFFIGGSASGVERLSRTGRNQHGDRRSQVERCDHGLEGIERHCARHPRRPLEQQGHYVADLVEGSGDQENRGQNIDHSEADLGSGA